MLRVLIDYTNGSNFRGRTEEDLYITSKIIYFTVNKGDSRYEFSCTTDLGYETTKTSSGRVSKLVM